MTKQTISRIYFQLGRIQGLAEGSGADEQETINACVDEIVKILDDEIQEADNDTQHKDPGIVCRRGTERG